jgi:two-component system, chemotaxis family, chemotaxis protein CheY
MMGARPPVVIRRVLLVEDSPTMRSYVTAMLESDGSYEVTPADSGFHALKALPGGGFDLVITDINMPDINGLELIKFVRASASYRDVPVLIISTEGREQDRARGLGLGANEFLVKPFTAEELLDAVRRLLPPPASAPSTP